MSTERARTPAADAARLRRLNELLEQALGLPDEPARRAWLAALDGADREFEPLLQAMLARAAVETDTFMRHPVALDPEILDLPEAGDAPGDTVGPWRLVRVLGHGGMATVWLAERSDGVLTREVALKLPRASWAPGLAQRMALERELLSALEHPNIARLYDAGVTDAGRPWLAMERVEGLPIDEYCRQQGLDIRARLGLLLQVCDAVAHAHARLIVHRDLKPANILVGEDGTARLLDFGVGKLLADGRPDAGGLTQALGRAITPDYASPEQVAARPVTVATDVYSLGVVAYELLTGQRPYRIGRKSTAALEEAILAADVRPASTRATDRRDARALRGDLDAVLAKAMAKSPVRRYPSVEALGADLRRHLAGEPVQAHAPSLRYRTFKFVRRHRGPLAAALAVLLALATGLGTALWQAREARQQAARAEQTKRFVLSILERAQPREGGGGAVLASDLLAVAGDRIEAELATDPAAAAEVGITVAHGLGALGEPQRSEAALRAAVARAEQAFGRRHPLTVHGRALLVESLSVQHPEEAARLADELVPDALAGLPATAEDAVDALRGQSFQIAKLNRAEESFAPLKQAIEIAERHLGPRHEQTVLTFGLLANTYGRFGRRAEQLQAATEALQRASAAFGSRRPHVTLTAVERWYAEALRTNDRPGDAVPLLRRVLQDQRALDGSDTPRVRNAMFQLGLALGDTGEAAEAMQLVREVVALEARQNTVDNEDRHNYQTGLVTQLMHAHRGEDALALGDRLVPLGNALPALPEANEVVGLLRHARQLAMSGKPDAAAGRAREALTRADRAKPPLDALRAEARLVLAFNARLQGRGGEALDQARAAWDDPGRARARTASQAAMAAELARAWLMQGDAARAQAATGDALALYAQAQVKPSPRSSAAWLAHAQLLLRAGRAAEAENALLPVVDAWAQAHPGSVWHGEALWWLARAQAQLGQDAKAAASRRLAAPMLREAAQPSMRDLLVARGG